MNKKMNKKMNPVMKRITVSGLLLAACTVYVAMQPFAVFAANVDAPGTATAWGYNGYGQLGNGTTTSSSKPVSAALPPGVTASAIAAGAFHSLAITSDGIYAWGANGDAGNSTTAYSTVPVKVVFPSPVTEVSAISALGEHSLALTDDGVYAWGYNGSGQLGDGTTTDRTAPVKVIFPPAVTKVTAIAAGFYHSLAVTDDGVYAWGSNGSGELGDGTYVTKTAPVKIAFPPTVTKVTAISAGGFHSFAMTDNGLYAWGNNTFGQLGDGTTTGSAVPVRTIFPNTVRTVTAISAGFWYSLAIADKSLYAWGDNSNGVLGGSSSIVPAKIQFPKGVTTVTAVAAGEMHSLAITDNGLYAWGNNSSGQLGMQGGTRYTPAKVQAESNVIAVGAGYYHSLALH